MIIPINIQYMPLILLFESDETGLCIFCQDDAFQIVDRNLILILILQKMVIVVSTQAGCLLTMVFCVFKEGYENGTNALGRQENSIGGSRR